jgi:hypothetical protein
MTKVEPTAPAHKVTVAAILRITGNNLNVLVRPNLRSRIVDLHDVQVTTPSDGQVLRYDSGVFENDTLDAGDVGAVATDTSGSSDVLAIWGGTQAEYDAIVSPTATTLYVVTA